MHSFQFNRIIHGHNWRKYRTDASTSSSRTRLISSDIATAMAAPSQMMETRMAFCPPSHRWPVSYAITAT